MYFHKLRPQNLFAHYKCISCMSCTICTHICYLYCISLNLLHDTYMTWHCMTHLYMCIATVSITSLAFIVPCCVSSFLYSFAVCVVSYLLAVHSHCTSNSSKLCREKLPYALVLWQWRFWFWFWIVTVGAGEYVLVHTCVWWIWWPPHVGPACTSKPPINRKKVVINSI